MSTGVQTATTLLSSTRLAAQRATDAMLAMQYDDGYWWAELTADTTLESDWLLLQLWLHPPKDGVWDPPNRPLIEKASLALCINEAWLMLAAVAIVGLLLEPFARDARA